MTTTNRWMLACGCALAMAACGGPLSEVDDLEIEGTIGEESENIGKADRPDVRITAIQNFVLPSSMGQTETRRIFTSADSFRRFFGVSAPFSFTNRWAVFYSSGVKATGGYRASITRVRTTNSGLTLKVTTRTESPGSDCIVTQAFTKPWTLVWFPRPTSPVSQYVRYYRDDAVRSCSRVSCANIRCGRGTFCVDGDTSGVRCQSYPTCETAEVGCAAGHHCEDRAIACVRAPCAPTGPQCVADEVVGACARVRCAGGTFCAEESGGARCIQYNTCANTRMACASNQRCVDRQIVCVRAPCAPTAPACEDN